MKKFLVLLMSIVVPAITMPLRGALQYNLLPETGDGFFSVDATQKVYIDIRKPDDTKVPVKGSVISKIGWYYYDDVVKFREKTADPGKKFFAPKPPKVRYGDMKTGVLGEFYPGDRIVLWLETTSADGKKETFTMCAPAAGKSTIKLLSRTGERLLFDWGEFTADAEQKAQKVFTPAGLRFAVSTHPPIVNNPLPGLIATVLLGIVTLLYVKKRKKLLGIS